MKEHASETDRIATLHRLVNEWAAAEAVVVAHEVCGTEPSNDQYYARDDLAVEVARSLEELFVRGYVITKD